MNKKIDYKDIPLLTDKFIHHKAGIKWSKIDHPYEDSGEFATGLYNWDILVASGTGRIIKMGSIIVYTQSAMVGAIQLGSPVTIAGIPEKYIPTGTLLSSCFRIALGTGSKDSGSLKFDNGVVIIVGRTTDTLVYGNSGGIPEKITTMWLI